MPAEITLLSAGAVKPGLVKVVDAFRRASRHEVKLEFATAPVIVKRLGSGEMVDLVIAPPAILDELAALGKIFPTQAVIGRIGVGVMVRDSTPLPRIATVDDFKQSLLKARSLVYNRASTGIYLETLFDRLGIAAALKSKSTRYPDFAAVLEHVKKGNEGQIGLGATTVIIESQSQGVKFVGPLPAAIQNYTIYSAAVTSMGEAKGAARELLRHLTSAATEDMFAAAGITGRE